MSEKRPSIFLCLSGGGLRAALFHYGCLKRLHETGVLGQVYATSATSGGSIAAALLALHNGDADIQSKRFTYDWESFEKCLLENAVRGLLGPTTLLVFAYTCYSGAGVTAALGIWLNVGALLTLAITLLLTGFLLHGSLICRLIGDQVYMHSSDERSWSLHFFHHRLGKISWQSVRRFVTSIFVPSKLRAETMNARLFGGAHIGALMSSPKIYLNVVDLNEGCQKIFSASGITGLDARGCKSLWHNYMLPNFDVTIAEAVAASSAIPFFFRPVTIHNGKDLLGVFVDGGVADNLAVNVAKAFAAHIHPDAGQAYQPNTGGSHSFGENTSLILVADGSMPVEKKNKTTWTRFFSLMRVNDTMMNQQVSDAKISALSFTRNIGIPTWIASLQFGIPEELAVGVSRMDHILPKIRTHLDSFNLQECAVLAYCGYTQIENLLTNELADYAKQYAGGEKATFLSFAEILPNDLGSWDSSPESIERTLHYSNRRLLPLRWIGRTFGI